MAYDRRTADDDEDVGELDIADYIVFLFALDTYMRWLEEVKELPVEQVPEGNLPGVVKRGLMLLRAADSRVFSALEQLLRENLTNKGSLQMLDVVMRQPPTARGAGVRALRLRTIISRGGTSTAKAIFGKSSRARKQVLTAVEAAMLEDADAALNNFAAISMRNKRLEAWIDLASDTAVPIIIQPTNPIQEAAKATVDQVTYTRTQTMLQAGEAPASDQAKANRDRQQASLNAVEQTAKDAARKSIERSGEEDKPITRSEAIAIATAASAASGTDPDDVKNLPPAFVNGDFPLDSEQQAAALTDGRVLVAAGAGSGKTTTMVSRIAYLVQERDVRPSRILACSFNRKAANELGAKVAGKVGKTTTDQMSIGTMHSLFLRFIRGDARAGIPAFGTPEEQGLFEPRRLIADSEPGKPPKPGPKPINMTKTIQALFKECGKDLPAITGLPEEWFKEIPKAKKCNLYVNVWKGNDVDVAKAKTIARTRAEKIAAVWYEFYMGLKGDLKGWKPPCSSKAADKWWDDFRPGGERLGDLDDQLRVFRDILVRDPEARKRIQGMFDHIMVDEAQDRNTIQAEIFDLMSEHITDGSDGKSIWVVGDDKQAIYQFRGAQPGIFSGLDGKEGWTTRMIRTNYRCEPEIVEAANRLAANNDNQIPMEARANPKKPRGRASIRVNVPGDHAEGAIDTVSRIVRETTDPPLGQGTTLPEYAILTRTNAELNDFETACVLAEIPYARTGGRGLFDSPESRAVLGYIDLAYGSDYDRMSKSLADALTKPDRGLYLSQDKVAKIVQETFEDVARMQGLDTKSVNPVDLITQTQFARQLALNLKMPYKAKIPDFVFKKTVDALTGNILEMGKQVMLLRRMSTDGDAASAGDVINHVLDNVKATVRSWDKVERREISVTKSLRDQIAEDLALYADDDEEEEEEEDKPDLETTPEGDVLPVVKEPNPAKGLGAVQFLFMMAEPNRRDAEEGTDPETAGGFIKKLTRIRKDSDKLRVNLQAWAKEQASKPAAEREKRPDCVVLSTIHSVKGAEWRDTTVVMAPGVFPRAKRIAPGEEPPTEEQIAAELEADRNLAYVALTRAEQNLTILCPPSGKHKGLSKFVIEAGLQAGENVEKPVGTPTVPEDKTASIGYGSSSTISTELDLDYIRSMSEMPEYIYGR